MAAMVTLSSPPLYLILCLMAVLLLPLPSRSTDPSLLQDFCVADLSASTSVNGFPCKPVSKVTSDDFFFDGLSKEGNTTNKFGGIVTPGNVLTFPGLNTLGIAMNRVDFAPGGINRPHLHPRSSETVFIVKGKLLVGFVTTGNVYFSKVLSAGQMFVIPRGLVHFQQNVGKGKALAITGFNSQLPGAVNFPNTLFSTSPSIPNSVLTKTFRVEEKVIDHIRSKFST